MCKSYILLLLLLIITSLILLLIHEPFEIYKESSINHNKYKVQEYKQPEVAADMLANINKLISNITFTLKKKYPNDERVIRMETRLKNIELQETPHEPNESSYTINKGELMSICLRKKNKNKEFHNNETLIFVIIHELAHVMSVSEGHTSEFMDNFRFILKETKNAGLYNPVNYSKTPITYCGVKVTHNPYYNSV